MTPTRTTLAALAFAALALPAAAQDIRIPHDDLAAVERGAELYMEHCAACHGADLEGQPNWRQRDADGLLPAPPHDETGHTWHHPDAQLFDLTKHGTTAVLARRGMDYASNMPGFGEVLSDADILAVLAYIKSTWPRQIVEMHDEINEGQ